MDLLKHLPITTFYLVFDKEKKELINFKFLTRGRYTKWGELKEDIALSHIDLNDLQKELELLSKAKEGDIITYTHKFYEEDKQHFYYIRIKVKVFKIEKNLLYCVGVDEEVSKEIENESIVESIQNSPQIGIVIYDEKIIYADDVVKKLLKKDDIEGLPITNILTLDNEMENILNSRKKGNDIPFHKTLKIVNFANENICINIYNHTIFYNNHWCGMALCIDDTLKYKTDLLTKILMNIGKVRLELFRANKYKRKIFIKSIYKIFNKFYNTSIEFKNLIIGEKNEYKFNELRILNNGKTLYIPINDGKIVLTSNYNNHFEKSLMHMYKEIKKVIDFTLEAIDKHLMLELLNTALQKSLQWVIITDENGNIVFANEAVEKISGYKVEELIGKNPKIFQSGIQTKGFYQILWNHLLNKDIFETTLINRAKDGHLFHLKDKFIPITLDGDMFYVSLGVDITKEKELEKALIYDELTKLLNKRGFLVKASSIKEDYYLLILDIQNFKAINSIEGIDAGDLVLKKFGEFLKTFFREEDLIARLGNDEFAIILKEKNIDIEKVLHNLLEKIKTIQNLRVNIGVSRFPYDANKINELIDKAYVALSLAKEEYENSYVFYNNEIQNKINFYHKSRQIILDALKNDNFEYFFQPHLNLKTEKIVSAEALIRIVENNKIISPYFFIEYAERSGLILEIEEKMFLKLRKYYNQIKLPFAVNISANSFKKEFHIDLLNKFVDIPITLELTEREVARDFNFTKEIFNKLKSMNYKIAIDDFGTGYSNFMYIKELDFDVLKIDMSFVKNMLENKKDLALVKTIITLAKELGLTTIAEGVETKAQLEILKDAKCDLVQGYYIAKPMPANEFSEFVKNFNKEG